MWKENYRWHFDYARLAWDSGFAFATNKSHDVLEKSNIGVLNIEQITQNKDVETVERFIPCVVQFKLDEERTKVLDGNFVKLFKVSQLAVDYLHFCKTYLDNTVVLLKNELGKANMEQKELKTCCDEMKNQVTHLKSKLQESENIAACSFKCEQCLKSFSTEEYLLAHIKRRHENQAFQQETDKLQMEIKELKERLNCTEKLSQSSLVVKEKAEIEDNSKFNELQQKFEILKSCVENELKLLHTQHSLQDKYEKWFESAFSSLKMQVNETASTRSKERRNSETDQQVQVDLIERHDRAVQTLPQSPTLGPRLQSANVSVSNSRKSSVDFAEMQEKVTADTLNRINQVEKVLQRKITGGMERLESQINTFWDKINKMEQKQNDETKQTKVTVIEEAIEENSNSYGNTSSVREMKIETKKLKQQIANRKQNIAESQKRGKTDTPVVPKIKNIFTPHSSPNAKQQTKDFSDGTDISNLNEYEPLALKHHRANTERFIGDNIKNIQVKREPTTKLKELSVKQPIIEYSESEESTESEESVEPKELITKPSNTSTLAKRSVTSMKKAMADGKIVKELEQEVEQVLNSHLSEMGVSPRWRGIPKRTFEQTMKVVKHQAALTRKDYPDYFTIRKQIIKNLDRNLAAKNNKTKPKMARVLNFSANIRTVDKTPIVDSKTEMMEIAANKKSAVNNNPEIENKYARYSGNRPETRERYSNSKSETENKKYSGSKPETGNKNERHVNNKPAVGNKNDKYLNSKPETGNKNEGLISTRPATGNKNDRIKPLSMYLTDSESEEIIKALPENNQSFQTVIQELKSFQAEKAEKYEDFNNKNETKSALKNYPSTGSLTRKKVLFDLDSDSKTSEHENYAVLKTNENGSTTSIASSVFDVSKTINVEQKSEDKSRNHDFDLDISDILI